MCAISDVYSAINEYNDSERWSVGCADHHSNLYLDDMARAYRQDMDDERRAQQCYVSAYEYCYNFPDGGEFYSSFDSFVEDVFHDMIVNPSGWRKARV